MTNQDVIHNFFDQHPHQEFITYSQALTQQQLSIRLHRYHFTKSFRTKNIILKAYHKFEITLLAHIKEKKLNINKINFGSNWVSLENNLVKDIISHQYEIKSLFKNGYLVDELFIPIFINLYPKYKRMIYYSKPVMDNPDEFQGNLRYINWWDGSPYTWRIKDYSKLIKAKNMGHLFSRKFDENIDNEIIKRIVENDLR